MTSLAEFLPSPKAGMTHEPRKPVDYSKDKAKLKKLGRDFDAALGSIASMLPSMEGEPLGYDEEGNLTGGYDPSAQVEKAISWLMPMGTLAEAKEGAKGLAHGVAKTFGGIGAKTADREALKAAEALEKSGAGMKDIHAQTGWFRAPWDGKWRWEIDDSGAKMTGNPSNLGKGISGKKAIFEHQVLADAYPILKKIEWRDYMAPSASGSYDSASNLITLKGRAFDDEGRKSTAVHELQHALQHKEGFGQGGSVAGEWDRIKDDPVRRKLYEQMTQDEANRLLFKRYQSLAGEAEARLVQDRMNLTPAQRREQYPLDSMASMLKREGIDPGANFENLIVRYGDGPSMSVEADLARLPVGAPELRVASDESLASVLDQIRGRNKAKGLDEDIATGAIRDEIARRNAVADLGLPEGNTAGDRAAAMGFGGDLFHGTTNDFPAFSVTDRAKVYMTDDPAIANIYAESTGRHRALREINAGPNVLPVRAMENKVADISDMRNGDHGWLTDNLNDLLGVNLKRGQYDEAARQGYDQIRIKDMMDLGGDNQTQYIAPAANLVRSRFAAFDPRRRDSANLLASLSGAAVLAPTLADYLDRR